MIYNYIKCESVIAKIMADLDSSEANLRTTDIKEWIFEAIDKIGAPMLYIKKEVEYQIHDNQVPIPADLLIIDSVAYASTKKCGWVPMNVTSSIFRDTQHKSREDRVINTAPPHDPNNRAIENKLIIIHEHQPMREKLITSLSLIYDTYNPKYLEEFLNHKYLNVPEYFIKPGWIVTNKNKGYVKLAYKSIATDERGYPMIPDLTSYLEAIYWYVVMKLTFPKWMSGKLGGKGVNTGLNIYLYTQQQWNFYRNQAYAEAMMPTADDMRNIKHDWNKLIPDYASDDTFFQDMNKEQIIYNDYYYGH